MKIGDKGYIVNQGTVRLATVVDLKKTRVIIAWANSRREMSRTVQVSDLKSPLEWITRGNPNTAMLPKEAAGEFQDYLDLAPRASQAQSFMAHLESEVPR